MIEPTLPGEGNQRTWLRLHRDLYVAAAIDEAIELYRNHAEITRTDESGYVVLSIASQRPARAEKVARELANYALGLTIQARGAGPGVSR